MNIKKLAETALELEEAIATATFPEEAEEIRRRLRLLPSPLARAVLVLLQVLEAVEAVKAAGDCCVNCAYIADRKVREAIAEARKVIGKETT